MRLLAVFITLINYAITYNCPSLYCECDSSAKNNSTWSVYCRKLPINDTIYAEILNQLPLTLKSLEIEAPRRGNGRNKFRWNDNINRFAQLKALRLVDCQIPAMSRSIRLPSLEVLDLSSNAIEHATMSNFAGMPKLRLLDLSNNQLNILPTGVFTYLRSLRSLSLAANSINDVSANLLRGLNALRSLRLDRNQIPVQQINELFSDVPNLEELYLNHCQLSSIAELALDRLPTLRSLGIAGNGLTQVPSDELRALPKLASLDISFNSIQSIRECAFCANNLTHIDASHNLLGLSPSSPFHVDAFRNIPIRHLDLSFNHMNEFDSTWLGWAQDVLSSIALSGNFLKDFNANYTHTLRSLVHLEMAHNDITHLPVALPAVYANLHSLNISGNSISYFPENLAQQLASVKQLDISSNKFVSFSQTDLAFLSHVDQVYLAGNPWDCSCSVHSLQAHMRERHAMRHFLHYDQVLCASPSLVEGHSVLAINDVNDCAVLFGARYGLTQTSEMLILLAALLSAGASLLLLLACFYLLRERRYKGSYVTREHSRTPLTMASCSSSATNAQLSPSNYDHHYGDTLAISTTDTFKSMPPLIPPTGSAYFGI